MSLMDSMNILSKAHPIESEPTTEIAQIGVGEYSPEALLQYCQEFQSQPMYVPQYGFIDPYVPKQWSSVSDTLTALNVESMFPQEQKIDPNRIFTSDIAALKTLGADQARTIKMFKTKFEESITDKGKFGLITAAQNCLLAIKKEEAAIKKNITELRIKQQQQAGMQSANGNGPAQSPYTTGHGFMDDLFKMPMNQTTPPPLNAPYEHVSLDQASSILEGIVSPEDLSATIQYEAMNPTTYVVVGDTDSDTTFETYAENGKLIESYPHTNADIVNIDRESNIATDSMGEKYPIKYRNA